jgi:hypothetical protein
MLDKCKEIATRAKLDSARFRLRKFRSLSDHPKPANEVSTDL